MAQARCSLELLLSESRSFGMMRLARLLRELASELALAQRTGVCSAPLSPASVVIEQAGTPLERARLPLSVAESSSPELQPALREMGTLIDQLLRQLSLGVDTSLDAAPQAPAPRRADQPLVQAWRRALAAIARRCASAGAYRSAAELVSDLDKLSGVSERIVARRQQRPRVFVCHPRPVQPQAALPKVMLRCA